MTRLQVSIHNKAMKNRPQKTVCWTLASSCLLWLRYNDLWLDLIEKIPLSQYLSSSHAVFSGICSIYLNGSSHSSQQKLSQLNMNQKKVNKYGLVRAIPDPVQRAIRQKCGFGCVVCGQAVIHYDHVEPEWHEAKEHDPENMAQLCGSCHDRKTRGLLSVETIKRALEKPKCLRDGYAISPFDLDCTLPKIIVGGNIHENTKQIIVINGLPILAMEQDDENSPALLSVNFFDENENKFFWTNENNEWHVSSDVWDSEINGQLLKIRSKPRGFLLKLRFNPPNEIYVEDLKMVYKGIRLRADKSGLFFLNKDKKNIYYSKSGLHVNHCSRAYDFTIDGSDEIKYGMFSRDEGMPPLELKGFDLKFGGKQ